MKNIIVFIMLCISALCSELSVSMYLESDMSLERACGYFVAKQGSDGLWQGGAALNSQILSALYVINTQESRNVFGKSFPMLKKLACTSVMDHIFTARVYLRQQLLYQLPKIDYSTLEEFEALAAMETLLLTDANSQFAVKLSEKLLVSRHPVLRSAAIAMRGKDRKAIIGDISSLSPVELYWAARTFLAVPSAFDGNWRNGIMSRLLDLQKSDGGWGNTDLAAEKRLEETAAAVQCMVLCLRKTRGRE